MKNFHKINILFIIGVLSLTLGAVGIINNIHMAEAQCGSGPYGQGCVSQEARYPTDYSPYESGVGFGDEVSPLATDGSFGQDYREPGDRPAQSSTVGESNIAHDGGNDPLVVLPGN